LWPNVILPDSANSPLLLLSHWDAVDAPDEESHPPGDNKASIVYVHELTPRVPFVAVSRRFLISGLAKLGVIP